MMRSIHRGSGATLPDASASLGSIVGRVAGGAIVCRLPAPGQADPWAARPRSGDRRAVNTSRSPWLVGRRDFPALLAGLPADEAERIGGWVASGTPPGSSDPSSRWWTRPGRPPSHSGQLRARSSRFSAASMAAPAVSSIAAGDGGHSNRRPSGPPHERSVQPRPSLSPPPTTSLPGGPRTVTGRGRDRRRRAPPSSRWRGSTGPEPSRRGRRCRWKPFRAGEWPTAPGVLRADDSASWTTTPVACLGVEECLHPFGMGEVDADRARSRPDVLRPTQRGCRRTLKVRW